MEFKPPCNHDSGAPGWKQQVGCLLIGCQRCYYAYGLTGKPIRKDIKAALRIWVKNQPPKSKEELKEENQQFDP